MTPTPIAPCGSCTGCGPSCPRATTTTPRAGRRRSVPRCGAWSIWCTGTGSSRPGRGTPSADTTATCRITFWGSSSAGRGSRLRSGHTSRCLDGGAVRLPAHLRVGYLSRPTAHRVHQLAHARPAVTPDGAHARGGAAAASALRLPAQSAAEGIRQRPRIARRDAGARHLREPGGLFRFVSRLPLLSRLHRSRFGVRRRISRGPVSLLRLPTRPQAASRGATASDRRIRCSFLTWRVALADRRPGPRRARRARNGRDRRPAHARGPSGGGRGGGGGCPGGGKGLTQPGGGRTWRGGGGGGGVGQKRGGGGGTTGAGGGSGGGGR